MRRLLAICVGVLALTCGLTIAQVAGPIALVNAQTPETEPNDDFETANALGEANISAQIIDGESDFYQIDANTTDALSLKVSNMTGGAAVEIRLYNSDRDELETDFRDRNGDLSITRKIPETGTYYVEIDGTRSQTTTEYILDVDRVTPSENDQFAPNDGFTSAATIPEGFNDARIVGGESDFYQIDANTTDALSLEVSNMTGGAAVEIRLYNSDRDELETDFRDRNGDLSITRKIPETGTYYVEIDGTRSQTTTEYTLDIDRVMPSENDQFAPNDGFTSAATIPEGFNDARIVGGESDFYQIDANTTDALSLEVSNMRGGAAVEVRLYNSDRDELETDFRDRNGDLSITRKIPKTGTYYVEIDGTRSQTTTEYTLDIDRVTPSENDQFAPNDGFTSAATITKEFSDARIVGGESDFYQIDANATDALSLEVIDISGNGGGGNDDVALRLYDSNRDTLETDTTNRAFDLSITRKLPETGTYYVEVDGTSSQTTTDYTLQSNQTGSDSAPETSPRSVVDEYAGEDGEVGPFDVIEAIDDFRQQELGPFEVLEIIEALRD